MNLRDQTRIRFGRGLTATSITLAVFGVSTFAVLGMVEEVLISYTIHNGLLAVGFGALAWVAIPSQPRNGAVWVLAWSSFFGGLVAAAYAVFVLFSWRSTEGFSRDNLSGMTPSDFPLPGAIGWQTAFWAWIPAFMLVLTLGLLLFPDGRPPSPRWKWVGWYSVGAIATASGGLAWLTNPRGTVPLNTFEGTAGRVAEVAIILVIVGALASAASLIVRYRRSSGVARRQIRWIAWGGSFLLVAFSLDLIVVGSVAGDGDSPLSLAGLTAIALLIGSFWLAVTKYRLYDVDVVISNTVTYSSLAVVIAALYAGAILGLVVAFGGPAEQGGDLGLALPIGATALVVLVFEPIRIRLQRWANRLVYGKRAAPHAVLSELTAQLSDTSAGDGLSRLAALLQEGTGAETAVVWLRVGDGFRAEAASPSDSIPEPREIEDVTALPKSELEISVPVRHGHELLGALGITKSRTHPVIPADETLLGDVAAGAGLLLRNLRLNAELAERARQLQTSRRRLIAAHDAARRRLERDLHDGAQQQVVALKVKLGLAKTIAEREGASDLAARVAHLADQTQEAVDDMRMLARGLYPPLLEAEGLRPALAAVYRTVELPLQIESGDLPRYSSEVEETAYFCVLAAVGRAQMAGATSARVDVQGDDSSLTIAVAYDSTADHGDLTALTDRVDAFGGTVASTSSAEGTTLTLKLPVGGEVMTPA